MAGDPFVYIIYIYIYNIYILEITFINGYWPESLLRYNIFSNNNY